VCHGCTVDFNFIGAGPETLVVVRRPDPQAAASCAGAQTGGTGGQQATFRQLARCTVSSSSGDAGARHILICLVCRTRAGQSYYIAMHQHTRPASCSTTHAHMGKPKTQRSPGTASSTSRANVVDSSKQSQRWHVSHIQVNCSHLAQHHATPTCQMAFVVNQTTHQKVAWCRVAVQNSCPE